MSWHTRGLRLIAVVLCLALARSHVAAQVANPTAQFSDEAVGEAIEKAKKYLWQRYDENLGHWPEPAIPEDLKWASQPRSGYHGGYSSLTLLALLSAGESYQDERVKRTLKWLAEVEMDATYCLGTRAQVWAKLPRQHTLGRAMLRKDVEYLIKSICQPPRSKSGKFLSNPWHNKWRKGGPKEITLQEALKEKVRYGTYGYRSTGDLPRRRVAKDPTKPITWFDTGSGGDHSNTQFGILGVWAGSHANLEIPKWYWQLVLEHYKVTQNPDGGWYYTPRNPKTGKGGNSSVNMTAASLAGSYVAFDNLYNDQFVKVGMNTKIPMFQRGLDWLDRNYRIGGNYLHYGLYAVERAGLASGYKYFGQKDWYKMGAEYLLRTQTSNGGWGTWRAGGIWSTDVVSTSFALLFLIRGRAPVLFNRLEYEGDWNNRPRALANLTRWASRQVERDVNWQIVNLKVPAEEWHDAPILLISGSKKPQFTDEDLDKLREFVWQGGLLMTVAEGGGGFRNFFDRSWQGKAGLYSKLFPDYELKQLRHDHPIYNCHFRIRRGIPVWGVSNGVRLLALHTCHDLPLPWQTNAYASRAHEFQLALNIVIFATDKASLRSRGTSTWPKERQLGGLDTVKVARVKYSGNWDPEPLAWRRLGILMANHWQRKLEIEVKALSELDASQHPVAALTGTSELSLSDDEKQALKSYVESGGTLIMDAAGGSEAFGDSAVKVLEELFGQGSVKRLAGASPVYQLKGHKIDSVSYRRAARDRVGDSRKPRVLAVMVKNRPAIFLSREDLTGGVAGYACYTCVGYAPGTPANPGSAEQLMRNLVLYAAGANESQPAAAK